MNSKIILDPHLQKSSSKSRILLRKIGFVGILIFYSKLQRCQLSEDTKEYQVAFEIKK